jgi:hypothetical protein
VARAIVSSCDGWCDWRFLCGKFESAELFVQVLEHSWYLSERAGGDVGATVAAESYIDDVLIHRPDEQAVLGFTPTEIETDETTGELEIGVAKPDADADADPQGGDELDVVG